MRTISKEILFNEGYKEYTDSIDKRQKFQKRITDENGTKYFINCEIFDFPNTKINKMFDFYVYCKTKNGTVKVSTCQWFNDSGNYSKNTIQDVYNYFEDLFKFHGSIYYE